MARKLTKGQKNIIDSHTGIISYDALPETVRDILEDLNDYETLWSDVDRYLWDKAMEARYKK